MSTPEKMGIMIMIPFVPSLRRRRPECWKRPFDLQDRRWNLLEGEIIPPCRYFVTRVPGVTFFLWGSPTLWGGEEHS